jgi:hypothetical protein
MTTAYDAYRSGLAEVTGQTADRASRTERIQEALRASSERAKRRRDETERSVSALKSRVSAMGERISRLTGGTGVQPDPHSAAKFTAPTDIAAASAAMDALEKVVARGERNRDWVRRYQAQQASPAEAPARVSPVAQSPAPPTPPAPEAPRRRAAGCLGVVVGAGLTLVAIGALASRIAGIVAA